MKINNIELNKIIKFETRQLYLIKINKYMRKQNRFIEIIEKKSII